MDKQTIVKGDIIIKGYYQGEGSLWASGNIYLPSDLQYRNRPLADVHGVVQKSGDGPPIEDFGVGQGGKQNLGGLISGGTIVIGDYLTSSVSNTGVNPDGSQMKDALGNPVLQSSAYVNNQPPDAFDPTQFPAGNFPIVDSAGRQ